MTNTAARNAIHASLETASSHAQAAAEGAALSGQLGIDAQLLAMSALYLELKAAGKNEAAAIIRGRALAIDATRKGAK